MFCGKCGSSLPAGVLFCPACGCKVAGAPDAQVQGAAPAQDFTPAGFGVENIPEVVLTPEELKEDIPQKVQEQEAEAVLAGEVRSVLGVPQPETIEPTGPAMPGGVPQPETIEPTGPAMPGGVPQPEGTEPQASEVQFCPNCGTKCMDGDAFCPNCGFSFGGGTTLPASVPNEQKGYAPSQKPKKKKLWMLFAGIGVCAAAAAILFVVLPLLGGKGGPKGIFYLKDNDICFASGGKWKPSLVSERLYEDKDDADLGSRYNVAVQYSEDGKYVYYKKGIDDSSEFDLYVRSSNLKKEDAQKLDSSVRSFQAAGSRVVYLKDSSARKLYVSNRKVSQKIASDVQGYWISEDKKYVMWYEGDGEEYKLYVQDLALKNEKLKIDKMTSHLAHSDDFSSIVYMKDDALYVCRDLKEAAKLASGLSEEAVQICDIGGDLKIYYEKYEDMSTGSDDEDDDEDSGSGAPSSSLYDFVEDDLKAEDDAMEEPREEDYTVTKREHTFWGTQTTTEVDDAYYDALESYEEKEQRDEIRNELKSQPAGAEFELFYYHNGESKKIGTVTGQISNNSDLGLLFLKLDSENVEKMKFSKIVDAYGEDGLSSVREAVAEGMKLCFLSGDQAVEVGGVEVSSEASYYLYDDFNKKSAFLVRYMEKYDEKDEEWTTSSELYTYTPGKSAELLNEEYCGYGTVTEDGIYYFADEKDNEAKLYLNDKQLDDDVWTNGLMDTDMGIYYLKDINSSQEEGDLYLYRKGKAEQVDDSVAANTCFVPYEGVVAYLQDYSFKRDHGDLRVFNGKKVVTVDNDVTCIVPQMK